MPFQGHLEVVDAKEHEEPIAGGPRRQDHQGRMVVRAPLMEAEQNGSIRIHDLTKVVMARSVSGRPRATGSDSGY